MKRLICLVGFVGLMGLVGCSQVTITQKKSEVTVMTKGWPLFQNVERVIDQTEQTVKDVCILDPHDPSVKKITAAANKPIYSDGQKAADETLALIKAAKSILEELFPRHTYTKTVTCVAEPEKAAGS